MPGVGPFFGEVKNRPSGDPVENGLVRSSEEVPLPNGKDIRRGGLRHGPDQPSHTALSGRLGMR